MAILTINDNPTVTDTIVFTLLTPDANGCFPPYSPSNTLFPYALTNITIYYVERDFVSGNVSSYQNIVYEQTSLQQANDAELLACTNPTPENIKNAEFLRSVSNSKSSVSPFYFNQSIPVEIVGNYSNPAWISTDTGNAIVNLLTDSSGNPINGNFEFIWQPLSQREGDYFICWTWTPYPGSDSLSSSIKFYLKSDTNVTTSIPLHATNPAKYTTLLDRYTPEMYKMIITENDRTPDVLNKLNNSIASGFTDLENLGNQIVDLQDPNVIHEALLPYLSNLFDLKLKTSDPTRWRGQIKRGVPLFKSKGTRKALNEAMEHAGIKVLDYRQLWQIVSQYTWQEVFVYDGTNSSFELEKVALPLDLNNFELWVRPYDQDNWVQLTSDYVTFTTSNGVTTMQWVGDTLLVNPLDLVQNDEIRVLYLFKSIPDLNAQNLENYVRSLPLMDLRDERDQIYPFKNWNVRVISPTDPLFNTVIPERHPFQDFIVFGKVRTEFPYGENIYNMEEYNGSIRNSKMPCDIDRDFVDTCSGSLSSSFDIDLEIQNLTNDRVQEAREILQEFMPFHAMLHTLNFVGAFSEFVEPSIESIQSYITYYNNDFTIAGNAQTYFNRVMFDIQNQAILRKDLATKLESVYSGNGIAYNDGVYLFCPATTLEGLGIDTDGTAILNVLPPSILSNKYNINNVIGNKIEVFSVSEPLDNCNNLFANDNTINGCAFSFDINNVIESSTLTNIVQDNLYVLSDPSINFGEYDLKTLFDQQFDNSIIPNKIAILPFGPNLYTIIDIDSNNNLILANDGALPLPTNTTTVNYSFTDQNNVQVSSTGTLTVKKRGRVTCNLVPVNDVVNLENCFCVINNIEYFISSFVPNTINEFYIDGYDLGDANSVQVDIQKKIISKGLGYFSHLGLKLQISGNLESGLGIQNGANSLVVVDDGLENNGFKENFIININDDKYFILDIDGDNPSGSTTITLSGVDHYWKTLSAGGTAVNVTIDQYLIEGATIMGQQFDLPPHTFITLDRSGRPVIDYDNNGVVTGLSVNDNPNDGEQQNIVTQTEGVTFKIEYVDGNIEEGTI